MALSREQAQARARLLEQGSIAYRFHLKLTEEEYSGVAELTFALREIPNMLRIDFQGDSIAQVWANGAATAHWSWHKQHGFLMVEGSQLKHSHNCIAIRYSCLYDTDGSGLVRFEDIDAASYLHTQFEPYYASRVFPLFDQPDLKATMALHILSCFQQVISNEAPTVHLHSFELESYLSLASTDHQQLLQSLAQEFSGSITIFPPSALLPTYIFGFAAGSFARLDLTPCRRHKNIPMSLFCRPALLPFLERDADFIFEITVEACRFYESFFSYEFVFPKYDHIFIPAHAMTAMENAGCVTFDEMFLYCEQVSAERKLRFANLIAHELCHHWFGNLVTMKWWDDLWLNESFADFISHYCLSKIQGRIKTIQYESSMASFHNRKFWGYYDDQLPTTHPISGSVHDTREAESIFDGITYAKGAAVLQQLMYIVGESGFSRAVARYFGKYAFKNACLQDIMAEFTEEREEYIGIQEWTEQWLKTASVNCLTPIWNHADSSPNATLTILMSPYHPAYPTLRFHKLQIGFWREDATVDAIETVLAPRSTTQIRYDGSQQYQAVLLNYLDHAYARVNIDSISQRYFSHNLQQIPDVLTRNMIWRNYCERVRDGEISCCELVRFMEHSIVHQNSDSIFERLFEFLSDAIPQFVPTTYRVPLSSRVFHLLLRLFSKSPSDSINRRVIIANQLLKFAKSEEDIQAMLRWWRGENEELKGHLMTLSQQWAAVTLAYALPSLSAQEKKHIFTKQHQADPSSEARTRKFTCDALLASVEEWQSIYLDFKSPKPKREANHAQKNAIAEGFMHPLHSQRLLSIKKIYFQDILSVAHTQETDDLEFFLIKLQPIDDDLGATIEGYRSISLHGSKYERANKCLLRIVDDLQRRQRALQTFADSE